MGIALVEIQGNKKFADLANSISDALHKSLEEDNMRPDDVMSVAASVLADYTRGYFGNEGLDALAAIIVKRSEKPMPEDIQ